MHGNEDRRHERSSMQQGGRYIYISKLHLLQLLFGSTLLFYKKKEEGKRRSRRRKSTAAKKNKK